MLRVFVWLDETCIVWFHPAGTCASHGYGRNDNCRPLLVTEFDTKPYMMRREFMVVSEPERQG